MRPKSHPTTTAQSTTAQREAAAVVRYRPCTATGKLVPTAGPQGWAIFVN